MTSGKKIYRCRVVTPIAHRIRRDVECRILALIPIGRKQLTRLETLSSFRLRQEIQRILTLRISDGASTEGRYSARNTCIGSSVAARHAGRTHATAPTAISTDTAPSRVSASDRFPPPQDEMIGPQISVTIKPVAVPSASISAVERRTCRTTAARKDRGGQPFAGPSVPFFRASL